MRIPTILCFALVLSLSACRTVKVEETNRPAQLATIPPVGPLMVKAYSSDLHDWATVVEQISGVHALHAAALENDPELREEWDKLPATLVSSMEKVIRSQDPLNTRLERLGSTEGFLREEATATVLGEHALTLLMMIEKERESFIIRVVNKTGDTLRIQVAGLGKPLMVPLNKVKRFMLDVGPVDRETTFTFSGQTWAGTETRDIRLIRGGGRELILESLGKKKNP